jgi:uncharacterized protein
MNTIGYFEIHSSDPKREIEFYQHLFGWNFVREKEMPVEYYRIETNDINGGLLKRPGQAPPAQYDKNAFVCSIQVKNYDQTHEIIMRNGGQVALPKFAVPGKCWQGYYLDKDHNTFGIFQVDENAR